MQYAHTHIKTSGNPLIADEVVAAFLASTNPNELKLDISSKSLSIPLGAAIPAEVLIYDQYISTSTSAQRHDSNSNAKRQLHSALHPGLPR